MTAAAAVCIFAKPPVEGQAKTRLAPQVGPRGAARLARAFLEDTVAAARALPWAQVLVAAPQPFDCGAPLLLQGEGDLGARLERVLRAALELAPVAIAVGADAPGLPARLFEAARAALEHADAALGPAVDGGFYLLALRRCPPGLLANLPWSQPDTCARTLASLRERGLHVALLEPWFDVDVPADLQRLADAISRGEVAAPRTQQVLAEVGC